MIGCEISLTILFITMCHKSSTRTAYQLQAGAIKMAVTITIPRTSTLKQAYPAGCSIHRLHHAYMVCTLINESELNTGLPHLSIPSGTYSGLRFQLLLRNRTSCIKPNPRFEHAW